MTLFEFSWHSRRRARWPLLASALMLACGSPPPPPLAIDSTSLRTPPTGPVIGVQALHGGHAWLGLPYAKAPVGPLRWRAPLPPAVWSEVREAAAFSEVCPQFASGLGGIADAPEGSLVGGEDCLYLNVYAPRQTPQSVPTDDQRLPVMVWIHGGGNTIGTAGFYDGSALASRGEVLVVTLNYRLGSLGWFRHASLREGVDPVEASGNFGTLDLVRALEWVRDNISAFGGDPNNVTIFGESAGGWNVFTLIASPLARGLFHRAISQSGVSWSSTAAEAENFADAADPTGQGNPLSSGEVLLDLLTDDGSASDRRDAKGVLAEMSGPDIAAYLREKSVEELFAAFDPDSIGEYDGPRVFEDGVVLPAESLTEALSRGAVVNRVPVLLGTNKDEEKLFYLFNPDYTNVWFGTIPIIRDRDRFDRDTAFETRVWRVVAVDDPAMGLSEAVPGQVFAYRFDWDEEPTILWFDLGELLGAAHGFEIPFVFGHWNLGPSAAVLYTEENAEGRETLSKQMMSYWAEFAHRGRPGRGRDGTLPLWAPWTRSAAGTGTSHYMVLDTQAGGGLRLATESETLDDIVGEILTDPSYVDEAERCRGLAGVHAWADVAFDETRYRAVGNGLCVPFPLTPNAG